MQVDISYSYAPPIRIRGICMIYMNLVQSIIPGLLDRTVVLFLTDETKHV